MNSGKLSYTVDFDEASGTTTAARGRRRCHRVVAARGTGAPGSRPGRYPPRDGRVWLRITGHGADGERANWVAFGDDAAVSGGLVGGSAGEPAFCGDAIADPLTGLHAALAVAESLSRGGGELIELSMAAVAATYASDDRTTETRCATTPEFVSSCLQNSVRTTPPSNGCWLKDGWRHADSTGVVARRHRDRHSGRGADRRSRRPEAAQRASRCSTPRAQTVIPGLHDHHVHLRSAAAALTSARVGPAEVRGRDGPRPRAGPRPCR